MEPRDRAEALLAKALMDFDNAYLEDAGYHADEPQSMHIHGAAALLDLFEVWEFDDRLVLVWPNSFTGEPVRPADGLAGTPEGDGPTGLDTPAEGL